MSELVMLDFFAGRCGASRAMRERGWTVTTIDVDPKFKTDVVTDIRGYHYRGGPVDLAWFSPPCDEFSRESMPWCKTGQPPSLTLIRQVYRMVEQIQPRYWVMENVRGAQRWLGRAPVHYGPVYLWGWFPTFDCRVEPWKEKLSSAQPEKRAEIPYALSLSLALAIERDVLGDAHASAEQPQLPLGVAS